MIDYLYVLDYKSDEDPRLCIGEFWDGDRADLIVGDKIDFQTCVKVARLLEKCPRSGPLCALTCLEVLTEKNLDYDKALAHLESVNWAEKDVAKDFEKTWEGINFSIMYMEFHSILSKAI